MGEFDKNGDGEIGQDEILDLLIASNPFSRCKDNTIWTTESFEYVLQL
jgi:hypothetical protein